MELNQIKRRWDLERHPNDRNGFFLFLLILVWTVSHGFLFIDLLHFSHLACLFTRHASSAMYSERACWFLLHEKNIISIVSPRIDTTSKQETVQQVESYGDFSVIQTKRRKGKKTSQPRYPPSPNPSVAFESRHTMTTGRAS
jgi:hypothetical protein